MPTELPCSRKTPARVTRGAISFRNSTHFALSPYSKSDTSTVRGPAAASILHAETRRNWSRSTQMSFWLAAPRTWKRCSKRPAPSRSCSRVSPTRLAPASSKVSHDRAATPPALQYIDRGQLVSCRQRGDQVAISDGNAADRYNQSAVGLARKGGYALLDTARRLRGRLRLGRSRASACGGSASSPVRGCVAARSAGATD
jgi:hypothetical protein